jgi:hypothetical protein
LPYFDLFGDAAAPPYRNKNPRMKNSGQSVWSLPEEIKKASGICQFSRWI